MSAKNSTTIESTLRGGQSRLSTLLYKDNLAGNSRQSWLFEPRDPGPVQPLKTYRPYATPVLFLSILALLKDKS
jgi:hypothetical protein